MTYNLSTLRPTSGNVGSFTVIVGFGEPNYKTTYQSPRLMVDSAQANGDRTITIRGWAFDPDNPSASVTIHTYIGGDVDTPGVEGWQYVSDQESSDVNNAYGISGNHCFNATIKTAKRDSQAMRYNE